MAKPQRKPNSTRKPPVPLDSHDEVEELLARAMPDLQPILHYLDTMFREEVPDLGFGVKWKKAYYGLPNVGWIIEMVPYDVSVNVVFLGGADFEHPPPLGDTDRSRYVKLRTLDEAQAPDLLTWVRQAVDVPGWK